MTVHALPEAASASRLASFSFTGSGREYFGIWIVNVLLTIVTLGLYSPWAKVRRLKYFYGNTWVDGHNFDYTARPMAILKGRLVVVAILIVYQLLVLVSPFFIALIVPYLFAIPWVINQSLAFNARMTMHRNVRFGFEGRYWGAFRSFILWPMIGFLTLTILYPFASRSSSRYLGNGTRFGDAAFSTDKRLKPYYGAWGGAILVYLGGVVVLVIVGMALGMVGLSERLPEAIGILGPLVFYGLGLVVFYHYAASVRNAAFRASIFDGRHQLCSDLSSTRYTWIMVSNLVITILTLGLARPWAVTRTWRYIAVSTSILIDGTLDDIVDTRHAAGGVASSEFLDFEGIDLGL